MYKITRSIFVIFAWIGCSIPLTAYADRIEGTVSPVPQDKTFDVLDAQGKSIKTVSVNGKGEFTVYLRPGLYRAVFTSGEEATIRSEAMPMRNQRITFNK